MARHEEGRAQRDAAGVGPYLHEGARLASLRQLGWKVSDGDADVRGWEVRAINGRVLGTVQDLLVDEEKDEVVLLDVDLAGTTRRAVVSIRAAQIDRAARVVLVDSADVQDAERFSTPARPTRTDGQTDAHADVHADAREAQHDQSLRDAAHRVAVDMNGAGPAQVGQAALSAPAAQAGPRNPVVVEELVVRRRVVDAADLPAAEAQGARVVKEE